MANKRNASVRLGLLFAAAAAMLAAAAAGAAAVDAMAAGEGGPPAAVSDPSAGELLIAAATIQDPRFYHSVILLVRHNENGAFGIVINRPLGERPIAALLADGNGDKNQGSGGKGADQAIEGTIRVFLGGPVQPQYGFLVHSADYHRPETTAVTHELAMTTTKEVLRDIAQHKGPTKYLFAIGYSGWGAGQLEGEIARRDWFTEPADADIVFDIDRDSVWDKALARRTREL